MPRFDASLTKAGSGAWMRRITGHGGLMHDLVDQGKGMLRALSETDQGDIRPLLGGHGSDVHDVDLAGDYLMPEVRDDRRDECQPILALIGDQNLEMLGLAVAHRRSVSLLSLTPGQRPRRSSECPCVRVYSGYALRLKPRRANLSGSDPR